MVTIARRWPLEWTRNCGLAVDKRDVLLVQLMMS